MSLPRYPKYKSSGCDELGEIPVDWDSTPLKHIAEIDSCGCYGVEPKGEENVLPVATTAQISPEGKFLVDMMPLRGFTKTELTRFGCSAGDILVVKSSGSATNIISGKAGIVTDDTAPFVFSNFLMRVRPLRELVESKWVYYVLRSHLTRQRVEKMCSTTTYPNLSVSEYCSALMPLPRPQDQSRITEFLDQETAKIDALISEQQRLIELLKEKRQAVISHAVTKGLNPDVRMKPSGVEWLGEVPEHWEVLSVRRISKSVQTGWTPSADVLDTCADDEVEKLTWYTPGDFGDSLVLADSSRVLPGSLLSNPSARIFPPNSVLLVGIGATLGRVGLTKTICSANQQINSIVPTDNVDGYFLAYSLAAKSDVMRSLSNASTIGILNQDKTKEVIIAVPPLGEQLEICQHLTRQGEVFDELIEKAREATVLLQERRTALISAAVTGKIDVRNYASTQKDAA
jgi:type I restriction enzyme S subunit